MPTGRIMIVEDESLVAEDLHSCLSRSGYEVVGIADTFDEAKHLAEKERPDLALLDIRLKGPRDGIELATELRRQNIGFVFLTSHSDEGTLARAEVTEPLGYVLKPFGAREMFPVLKTAMYRHAAEVRLRSLEYWLQTTLRSIGDAVIVTDLDGNVTFMNPVAEQLTNRSLRAALGQSAVQVMPIVDGVNGKAIECIALRAMAIGAIVHVSPGAELVRGEGSRVPVDDSAAPVRDRDGVITGAVVVLRDATARKQLELQRREAEKRMQDAERLESLGVLAGGLAHDLNNILTSILGGVALCREAGASLEEPLQQIEDNTRAAAELCRRMLAGSGSAPITPEAVDVATAVRECIARERLAAPPQLQFVEETEQPGLAVLADPVQLRQVLGNLLRNAVEAKAGRDGHVVVRTGGIALPSQYLALGSRAHALPRGHYVWIEVADDGPGISRDVLARIFEPFFTTKFTGRGLGLAGVHGIVRRHGGAVDVDSEVGLGTRFRVFWPAATAPIVRATPPQAPTVAPAVAGTVLVIDDDDTVRGITCRMMRLRGWTCHEASTGERGLEMLRDGLQIDALLLDMLMPGTPGADVLATVRQLRPELPVLLVSGFCGNENAFENDPLTDFLPKPFSADELIARVQRLQQRRKA